MAIDDDPRVDLRLAANSVSGTAGANIRASLAGVSPVLAAAKMRVTCICPTMEPRREWLPKAIACFQAQTYEDKELLIVTDADWDTASLIPDDPAIRLIEVTGNPQIGALRNICCERSSGEIVCHFDDDDHSYPGRVADQVQRLAGTGKAVTGYRSMSFTDGERWWRYSGSRNFVLDLSLCYRRDFWERHRFPNNGNCPEHYFRMAAVRENQLAIADDGSDMMYASIHPGNTSPRMMTPGNITWEELSGNTRPEAA